MSDAFAESEWCRHCGEHRLAHGETKTKVANLNRITDHEFEGVCSHSNSHETLCAGTSYCPDCGIQFQTSKPEPDYVSSGPQPEFPLDELVTKDVKEPEIEFNFGLCKICEIPLTEEYEHVSFCGDCADETWQVIMSGNKGEGKLPN